MHEGRVVQTGSPLDVYDYPTAPAVAQFLGASPLRARIKEGRAEMGALSVDAPAHAREGARAMAYVHSRDVYLARPDVHSSQLSLARIIRIRRAGGLTKVVVEMPEGDQVTLELQRDDFDKLNVNHGDRVRVHVRAANVFVLDYQI
jgi:sulfate/thiosulfate transport system ATP-binding protein